MNYDPSFVGQVWELDGVVLLVLGPSANHASMMRCLILVGDEDFNEGEVHDWACSWLGKYARQATRLA